MTLSDLAKYSMHEASLGLFATAVLLVSYPCIRRTDYGGPRRIVAMPFGTEKLEWCGYSTVKKSLMICLAVSLECRRVTHDRRTDGHLATA